MPVAEVPSSERANRSRGQVQLETMEFATSHKGEATAEPPYRTRPSPVESALSLATTLRTHSMTVARDPRLAGVLRAAPPGLVSSSLDARPRTADFGTITPLSWSYLPLILGEPAAVAEVDVLVHPGDGPGEEPCLCGPSLGLQALLEGLEGVRRRQCHGPAPWQRHPWPRPGAHDRAPAPWR